MYFIKVVKRKLVSLNSFEVLLQNKLFRVSGLPESCSVGMYFETGVSHEGYLTSKAEL